MNIIKSKRLVYRKIKESDFDTILNIMNDKGVQNVWEHYFIDEDVHEWISRRLKGYLENGIDYLLAINKETNEVVGQIGLLKENINNKTNWGLGYILKSEYYGRGYATEGARAMIGYAFNTLNAPRVICSIRSMNKSSIKVAKRLGMEEIGAYIKVYKGKEMPHLLFELRNKKD